ncbi:MAG: GTPase [Sedimentitalea sp.]
MTFDPHQTPTGKPRIAIMGEFSAGKSTLCNILLRGRALPEQVTATRLPPIWMSKGKGGDHRVCLDGSTEPVSRGTLDSVPFDDTRLIHLHFQADILDHCDLIDFPGISDPNMDSEVWERVLVDADAVIWLTHATQAWRQSESAVWDTVPPEVQAKSVLLVTRFDKLTNPGDRNRVLNRVTRETEGLFDKVFPISLLHALHGFKDYDQWVASGAEAFTDHLLNLINTLDDSPPLEHSPQDAPVQTEQPKFNMAPARTVPRQVPTGPQIVPRRVKPKGNARRNRPFGITG